MNVNRKVKRGKGLVGSPIKLIVVLSGKQCRRRRGGCVVVCLVLIIARSYVKQFVTIIFLTTLISTTEVITIIYSILAENRYFHWILKYVCITGNKELAYYLFSGNPVKWRAGGFWRQPIFLTGLF